MTKKQGIQLFEEKKIRTVWDDVAERWYFSIVDVVSVLTESKDPALYWRVLKKRLKDEGNETVTNCNAFKLIAADGKMRKTDVADQDEPFKQWMAQVASNRIDQIQDPELSIEQAIADYRRLGYGEKWINQRIKSIEVRKDLTDEWERSGVQGQQYAALTDIITKTWSGLTTREYKHHKGLKKENKEANLLICKS